jgi:ribose transport system permease protein
MSSTGSSGQASEARSLTASTRGLYSDHVNRGCSRLTTLSRTVYSSGVVERERGGASTKAVEDSGRIEDPAPTVSGALPESSPTGAHRAFLRLFSLQEFVPGVALVVLVLFVGLSHPRFFSSLALVSNIRAASFVAIIAYGMVFLLAMGEIDLSVGGIYGISFFICAKLGSNGDVNMYLAALIAIVAGVGLGLANGLLVKAFKAPVIIVTLGTYSLYAGLVAVISHGNSIGQALPLQSSFFSKVGGNLLGIPVAGWIALVLCVLLTIVLMRSRTGAMIRAVGSNRSAAAFSGVPAQRLRIYALMLTGGLAGLSGVLTLAYAEGGDSSIGTGFELQVIAAAIIGGTAVTGGSGSVPGGLIGALIVATIDSGLIFFNVNPLWSNFVTGVVILIAVGTGTLLSHRRAERLARLDA